MSVFTSPLESGESAGMLAVEITSIPDVSIIAGGDAGGGAPPRDFTLEYKRDFASLLSAFFQAGRRGGGLRDVSAEILYITQPVAGQTYSASIRLLVVLRAIEADRPALEAVLEEHCNIFAAALQLQKYEFRKLSPGEFLAAVKQVRPSAARALAKEENIAVLQNQMLNECYAFERVAESGRGLERLVSTLVLHPHCAVSFQLIPAAFTPAEAGALGRMATVLETLNKGVHDQMMGSIGFALAEKHAQTYKYYSNLLNSPLFLFNIVVIGGPVAVNAVASSVSAQINGAGAVVKITEAPPEELRFDASRLDSWPSWPWLLHECLPRLGRNPEVWGARGAAFAAFQRLPYVISADEAAEFFRLPVGGPRLNAGLAVNTAGKNSRAFSGNIINGGDITVGALKSSSRGDTIGFFLKDLTKHMLVVGTPGSGKTTFSVSLLDRLWKAHGIPFLVIEPAKNEYRALVQSIPGLQVFTPGKNFISPFIYNPFVPPENVVLESYKSVLKTAFAAAVTMSSPLDRIFEETVHNCYSDFRWLDTYTGADGGRVFNMQDFIKCFQKTFDAIGYTGDARNIGRAGLVRLAGLASLFDNYNSIPVSDILSKPTLIELAAVENSDQKALLIALLLLSILSYVNRNFPGGGGLRNVILLEEAHVLLDSGARREEGAADPAAIAKNLLKRMLAEIRSYGVGLVIADQSPRKAGTDVVALTNIKLAFRLVEREDKEIISDSTNMTEVQTRRLARLKPGEAMLFFDRLEEPEEVVTPDYRADNNISISLTDDGIRERSMYWKSRPGKLKPYPECACIKTCPLTCDFTRRGLAREMARRVCNNHFTAESRDIALLKKIYTGIGRLTAAELNDEPLTAPLLNCVRLHFLRKIRYATKIPLGERQVVNTLNNIKE
ncbi:MAG: ATP-binding protein [Opitutaceae bacterium]|jgi:hypothetical protein|nr:ATP-binding protein [Opitutaceae bacterium]